MAFQTNQTCRRQNRQLSTRIEAMGRPAKSVNLSDGFAILEPRIKHVSERAVRKKWKKMPVSSHGAMQELIVSAKEQSREKKRGRAGIYNPIDDCVQEVADKLIQKLPRIPFPPKTEETQFDLEANLHRMRKIEDQLTSSIHSMKLLRAQILKEEKQLKEEEAELEYLQRSLQSNETYRRQQSKTLHPAARSLLQHAGNIDLLALDEKSDTNPSLSVGTLLQDGEMKSVLNLLQNHLDNMDNNIAEIRRVANTAEVTGHHLQYFTNTLTSPKMQKQAPG